EPELPAAPSMPAHLVLHQDEERPHRELPGRRHRGLLEGLAEQPADAALERSHGPAAIVHARLGLIAEEVDVGGLFGKRRNGGEGQEDADRQEPGKEAERRGHEEYFILPPPGGAPPCSMPRRPAGACCSSRPHSLYIWRPRPRRRRSRRSSVDA